MESIKLLNFVTNNREKITDIKKMLGDFFELKFITDLELIEIQDLSVEEVALFKAKQAFELVKQPVAVSDSGLEITSLKNFPGALVKFVNTTIGQEGLVKLLEGSKNREAFFVAAIAYYDKDIGPKVFVERDEGSIALHPRGKGWHFDRIFIPKDDSKTWAELGRKAKNKNSAFKRALEKLSLFLLEK